MKLPILLIVALALAGCNYNYYQGKELEEGGRFEEANIEYHRAYTSDPGDEDYQNAFERTAEQTTEDLLLRYQQYLDQGKMEIAYDRLKKAKNLSPNHPVVLRELRRWTSVLIAGKVDFSFESLKSQIPLADEMELLVRINTSDPQKILDAKVDNRTHIFAVEDVIYNVSQKDLIFYSLNSIGIKLSKKTSHDARFIKFVDVKIPYPKDVNGSLDSLGDDLKPVEQIYPLEELSRSAAPEDWVASRGLVYSLELKGDRIWVESSNGNIDYLPQLLYINNQERRIFLDFGKLNCIQRRRGGFWTFKRVIEPERQYLKELRTNLMYFPYFYFREGAYAFVKKPS
ncbi:MAG: hypothetical protein A2508_08530 [Candidatus Lambdaproteobacteria bacterium RIFOXYD12_FULL_49_8]|uniref:Uncharacterized protein n=1 Tax=Candidatus Lambdaproteobacteria bacterium RIFOXYD2_FULL_50_16 TaxID=1817772 RepID=A0A1F6G6J5_9PROT|nr:MAG: hypothetical protein A2527_11385 [Candidatus Lambdaproteobacteria bacterium RIFOXYD2_FULL_50_16]OGG96510.1 MAG: hypothetical protein A2508_08530 [Candidatus Lambdaproteobacteria bacterium RIFOXYD12_FULL_49_8]